MKVFVKTVDTGREAFMYVRNEFSKFSEAKVKEGIFVGPQTQEVMQDPDFHITLSDTEKSACNTSKSLCTNFLGNRKGENYREIVSEMLKCFQVMRYSMSLKIYFLDSHLDFLPKNLGEVSDERCERFHQDFSIIEKGFVGRFELWYVCRLLWCIMKETPDSGYKRKDQERHFKFVHT
jgi:hypothetical protein